MRLSMRAKRMLRRVIATFCACACVFAVSACGADDADGKIRIGIKFDQPGLGFKKSGTYVGFDVDVAKYIAKKLGYSEDQIVLHHRRPQEGRLLRRTVFRGGSGSARS